VSAGRFTANSHLALFLFPSSTKENENERDGDTASEKTDLTSRPSPLKPCCCPARRPCVLSLHPQRSSCCLSDNQRSWGHLLVHACPSWPIRAPIPPNGRDRAALAGCSNDERSVPASRVQQHVFPTEPATHNSSAPPPWPRNEGIK
jgi:hypothetical protein